MGFYFTVSNTAIRVLPVVWTKPIQKDNLFHLWSIPLNYGMIGDKIDRGLASSRYMAEHNSKAENYRFH